MALFVCVVVGAVAVARGGLGGGAVALVVIVLMVVVRVAFRLLDEAERREEDRAER